MTTVLPMPTAEEIKAGGWLTLAERDISLLLVEHGVNPHEIPQPKVGQLDVLNAFGYLRTTGRIIHDQVIETERVPWPAEVPVDVIDEMLLLLRGDA